MGGSLMLLSAQDCTDLRHRIPALTDYPCAPVPLDPAALAYPALGWQLPAMRAALDQLVQLPEWLQVRMRDCIWAGSKG